MSAAQASEAQHEAAGYSGRPHDRRRAWHAGTRPTPQDAAKLPDVPIARRTIRPLPGPPAEPLPRLKPAAGTPATVQEGQHYEEFRTVPVVRPFLSGGAEFKALSRRFGLGCNPEAVAAYEQSLFGYLSARWMPLSPDVLARIGEACAIETMGVPLRRETEFCMDYAGLESASDEDLYAAVSANPGMTYRAARVKCFIAFRKAGLGRAEPDGSGKGKLKYCNDKMHINVSQADLPLAWKTLRPLLLSEDNPFPLWKLVSYRETEAWAQGAHLKIALGEGTRQESREAQQAQVRRLASRHQEGAQFTLYAHRTDDDPGYHGQNSRIRQFLAFLDWELSASGVQPGVVPVSDVTLKGLDFLSYRNDRVGSRGADYDERPVTRKMKNELRRTPFYLAIDLWPRGAGPAALPKP